MTKQIVCAKCGAPIERKSGKCKPCEQAYMRAYYLNNAERLRAAAAKRLEENRDQINARERERYVPEQHWDRQHPERARANRKAYVAENRQKRRVYEHNRRARKLAGGDLPKDINERLFTLQRGLCPCCRLPLGEDFHLDHIKALSKGGTNTVDNVQLLRAPCNLAKNAKDPIDFMQSRGFLC